MNVVKDQIIRRLQRKGFTIIRIYRFEGSQLDNTYFPLLSNKISLLRSKNDSTKS